jgi:peroxiredoxin
MFIFADHIGKPYIPFHVTTLSSKVIDNDNSKGKVTFINFWFMGCPGCVAEFGELNKLYVHYAKNKSFQFVAITYDDAKDLPGFLTKHRIKFPVACVSSAESHRLNNGKGWGYPSNFIIDKQGNVVYMNMGSIDAVKKNTLYSTSEDSIITLVNKLLKD